MSENKYPICGYAPGSYNEALHLIIGACEEIAHSRHGLDHAIDRIKKYAEEGLKAKPAGAVWVKAADRLPGWKNRVKWRDGNNHSYATDGKISFFEMEKPNLEGWEWLDEAPTSNHDQITAALRKFISMHEAGLLPNRFTYEEGKKALEGLGTGNDAIEFAEWLDCERNNKSDNWKDMNIWGKENAFKTMLKLWQQSKSK